MSEPFRPPSSYQRFVELFNGRRYWDSHEALEGAWREGKSEFYHGLILLASAYVHLERENPHGVQSQLAKATKALTAFAPHYLGLDVRAILDHARHLAETFEAKSDGRAAARGELHDPLRLHLDPRHVRGTEAELAVP